MASRRTKILHRPHPEEIREPYLREVAPSDAEDVGVYSGIGADIRAARVRAGLDLREVAAQLHIRQQHLEAIEDGRFDDIPGRIYVIGFLRSYADYLGFDGEEVVDRFKAETGHDAAPAKLVFPTPAPESRMPKGWLLVAVLIAAGAVYGGWYYTQDAKRLSTDLVADVPTRLLAPSPAETSPPPATNAETPKTETAPDAEAPVAFAAPAAAEGREAEANLADGAAPDETEPAAEPTRVASVAPAPSEPAERPAAPEPAATVAAISPPTAAPTRPADSVPADTLPADALATSPPTTNRAPEVPRPAAEPAAPASGVAETPTPPAAPVRTAARTPSPPPPVRPSEDGEDDYVPQVFGIGNTDARVIVRARMDSWVQVRGADNELLLTRILHAGDVYMAPNRPDLILMTGNAGALEILVDGKTVPPIGPVGTIRRRVSLDADALLNGTAVRED